MLKLLSLSDDPYSLEKFGGKAVAVREFLARNGLDGLELMRWENPQEEAVPLEKAVGRHMPYWPMFLDFWRGDEKALLEQFDTLENCRGYYYALSRDEFVRARHDELLDAARMGVKYVVFHAAHSHLECCYSGSHPYGDEEIIDAYVGFFNEILKGVPARFEVLFENHWLPGLTFLDGGAAMRLLERVEYPNKGFVLDVGHLMNTNLRLKDENEAVGYILKALERLGEAARHIRAMHLNSSISGPKSIGGKYAADADFMTRLLSAMRDVGGMDPHQPFVDRGILKVLEFARPEYLVYELAAASLAQLQAAVSAQNEALGGPIV
ncbi:MAG: TIM barrel protein [Bacillota bacterium]